MKNAWSIETSYKPEEWTKENPAWGQCAVTTKLMYELLGGVCMAALFRMEKNDFRWHYWNVIQGIDIDLTWRQMPAGTGLISIAQFPEIKLITNNWMQQRYDTLKRNYYKSDSQVLDIRHQEPAISYLWRKHQ